MPKGVYQRNKKQEPPPQYRFPVSLETEKALAGCSVAGHEELFIELSPEDFYDDAFRSVYTAARQLFEESTTPTALLVHERSGVALEAVKELLGPIEAITQKEREGLVKELKRVSKLRTVAQACKIAQEKSGKDIDAEEVLAELENSLYAVSSDTVHEAEDGSDVMDRVIQDFSDRLASGRPPGPSTGLRELDRAILGLMPKKLYIVAARPSMGKTAFVGTIRRAILQQSDFESGEPLGVAEFNLEMGSDELMERELAYQSGVNLRKVISAKGLTEEESLAVRTVKNQWKDRWKIITDTYSIHGLRRKAKIVARRMKRKGIKLALVILDYIQLAGQNGDGREQTVAEISRVCKLLSKELNVAVIAISQLNRSCELREDKRPIMSDLRESGAIEQDADTIIFLYREYIYDTTYPPEDAEVIIRKQRNGPIGPVKVRYNPKLVSFENGPLSVGTDSPGVQHTEGLQAEEDSAGGSG